MFSTSLPTLPCWSQLGRLEKLPARVPTTEQGSGILMEPVILPALENREQAKKVFVLEKRIEFLQQEQSATLRSLHSEIHLLKKENTDLKYELIMLETTAADKGHRSASHSGSAGSSGAGSADDVTGIQQQQPRITGQEETGGEAAGLKEPLGPQLTHAEHTEGTRKERQPRAEAAQDTAAGSSTRDVIQGHPKAQSAHIPITSLRPLLVHTSPLQPPRAPTSAECEKIIHQLWRKNRELLRIKVFLNDVIQKNKWTPEAQHLAKAFVRSPAGPKDIISLAEASAKDKVRTWVPAPMPGAEKATLPALRQTLGNFADRQKRAQAVQKSRFQRTLH
ncbi:coiled-coil domain-containing protein 74B [Ascaphus truei]|uniref:coiled-coil domain-containing protein 74B n=1 Tax=Ascaphus truei TaxID=8439 RepID=UPI003F5A931E